MANPALKNGYISIANELVEKLASVSIPSSEMRIIWVVWRKTWGWKEGNRHKDWDWISISQFEKITGIKHANVVVATKSLVCKHILLKVENRYKFNQNYEQWVVCKRIREYVNTYGGSMQTHTKSSMQTHTYKRKKETNTKETYVSNDTGVLKVNKKPMKKNSFNYNENNTSDSYEDVIDLESNERAVPKSNTSSKVRELVDWAVNRRGRKFISYPKQYKAINQLKNSDQNITPDDIKVRWVEMEQDPFWKEKGFDFMSVMSSFERKPLK